jgi:branched-chain amino acid transport system ATP-binding protein
MDNLRVRCSERKEIMEAIEFVQLNDLLDRIAGELSLFEQKRLEMTMALALRPKLLLLDELTSGLSLMEKKYFQNLIGKIKMDFKPAIVLIEHDVKIALEISDQIAVLYYGTVLASGKPSEVIHDEKVIKNYLGRKAV